MASNPLIRTKTQLILMLLFFLSARKNLHALRKLVLEGKVKEEASLSLLYFLYQNSRCSSIFLS
jgi:hypothetical protein